MIRPILVFLLAVGIHLTLAAAPLQAQAPELPAPVRRGLELLVKDSAAATVTLWARGWSAPSDEGKAEIIANGFAQLAQMGGPLRAFDIIAVHPVTPHLLRIYVLLRYERLPVYMELRAYDSGAGTPDWRLSTVTFNTDPEKVLPSSLWTQ